MCSIGEVEKTTSFFYAEKQEENNMHENKNEQNTGTKTIKKIGKVTYEVVVYFNENATETLQDKLKRIMLREMEREKDKTPHKNDQKVLDKLLQELQDKKLSIIYNINVGHATTRCIVPFGVHAQVDVDAQVIRFDYNKQGRN